MKLPNPIDMLLHGKAVERERLELKAGWNPLDVLRATMPEGLTGKVVVHDGVHDLRLLAKARLSRGAARVRGRGTVADANGCVACAGTGARRQGNHCEVAARMPKHLSRRTRRARTGIEVDAAC